MRKEITKWNHATYHLVWGSQPDVGTSKCHIYIMSDFKSVSLSVVGLRFRVTLLEWLPVLQSVIAFRSASYDVVVGVCILCLRFFLQLQTRETPNHSYFNISLNRLERMYSIFLGNFSNNTSKYNDIMQKWTYDIVTLDSAQSIIWILKLWVTQLGCRKEHFIVSLKKIKNYKQPYFPTNLWWRLFLVFCL